MSRIIVLTLVVCVASSVSAQSLADAQPFGLGGASAGTGGLALRLEATPPVLGGTSSVTVRQGPPSAPTEVWTGDPPMPLGVALGGGNRLFIDISQAVGFFAGGVNPVLVGVTGANGDVTFAVPVPNDPSLDGIAFTFQAVCIDATSPVGVVTSNGLLASVGARETPTLSANAPQIVGSVPLAPPLLGQIQQSPDTQAFETTFQANGWTLDYSEGMEVLSEFPNGQGPIFPSADMKNAYIPVRDGGGQTVGYYHYTSGTDAGVFQEGVEFIRPFQPVSPQAIRTYVDASFANYYDIVTDGNGVVVGVSSSGDGGYLACVVGLLQTILAGGGAMGASACLTLCTAGGPACTVCLISTGGILFGVWWDCD